MNRDFWRGKRVFLTGHTGFKGSWLALWLLDMGAEVSGYALAPATEPNFYDVCGLHKHLETSSIADIRDAPTLADALRVARPEVVLHLAAQALVRYSYLEPAETYATNVMGTVNLLEAVRATSGARSVVNVTTDKCYENREWVWPYRESDPMGGHDPYSSSKACSEIVTAAYRRSYLGPAGVHLASARAGNVIGGGDWASDRLIPDFLRAIDAGQVLTIRSPLATRPWQHVLEPLSGYLTLAEKLFTVGAEYADAWNFGPSDDDARTVQWIVAHLCARTSDAKWQLDAAPQPHEANQLKLDSSKARTKLDWHPRWNLSTALSHTLEWHEAWKRGSDMADVSRGQIRSYESAGPS
jgi:CDP-glucose 4,6-dehydratase